MVREAGMEMRIGTCVALRERSVRASGGPGTPAQAGSGCRSEGQDWKEVEEQEHRRPPKDQPRRFQGEEPLVFIERP